MENSVGKFKRFLKTFPKKHHVEYITALLSVPVLLSVIALNLFNLQGRNKTPEASKEEKPIVIQTTNPPAEKSVTPTPSPERKKQLGPINISYPKEGQTVSEDPVCIIIKYDNENYYSAVWSYRINNGPWSNYTSNDPCLYNLPAGNVKFELRAQSTVSQEEETLERNFTYKQESASPSASPTP